PKAIIAPHAGFVYSGATAAFAYEKFAAVRARIRRVVLLGPAHRVGFRGLATTSADFFRIPLGDIPIDKEAIATVRGLPQVVLLDKAHVEEHSLEVHLPFLWEVLDDFMLVPLVVGDTRPEEVAQVLEKLWGGSDTLIVISSDLSHYLPYEQARQKDDATARAIETLDITALHPHDACGHHPIAGLLYLAQKRGMLVDRLDLRNSGDTAGDKGRVVGYGAWAFFEPGETMKQATLRQKSEDEAGAAMEKVTVNDKDSPSTAGHVGFSMAERQMLLKIAADSIEHGLGNKKPLPIDSALYSSLLREKRATFVTIEKDGNLRGCIGTLQAVRPLVEDIAYNAFQAAFRDSRFPLLTREESDSVVIKLSLLTPAEPMMFDSEADLMGQLRPGVDGLILIAGSHRGTFLPSVWESLPEPMQFLRHLKMKAGLAPDVWPSNVTVLRYTTEVISP
ncbi:MAG: AmmeMemoRadiSam system protein B, partial [Gammaproteobacteria bacterium]|nr:AmmeMemoRadiSam system protein B [Gammaproteobacteria bacterium]